MFSPNEMYKKMDPLNPPLELPKQPVGPVAPEVPEKLTEKQQLQKDCQTTAEKVNQAAEKQEAAQAKLDQAKAAEMNGAMPPDFLPTDKALKDIRDAQMALDAANQEVNDALDDYNEAKKNLDAYKAKQEFLRPFDKTYVVHWAEIKCSCGLKDNRPSFLKLEESHGIFVKKIPQLHIMDQKVLENIIVFPGCKSLKNPSVKEAAEAAAKQALVETKRTKTWFGFGKEREVDVDESLMEECVGECNPIILTSTEWTQGKEKVEINGHAPLLRRSTLLCQHGGIITIDTSGQPE